MIKKILFLSLISLVSAVTNAQDFKKHSSITIAVGPSIPTGEFANKDFFDEKSGLADVGGYAHVGYSYQFSRFFGAVAAVSGRIHGVNKNALQTYALPTGSGSSLNLRTTTWRFLNLMGGISQTVPLTTNEKLTVELREMVGIQFSNSPEIQTSGFIPGIGSLANVQKSQAVNSLAYSLGFGVNYIVASNLGLKLFGDYQGASPAFSFTTYPADAPVEQKIKQQTSAVSLGLGVTFGF